MSPADGGAARVQTVPEPVEPRLHPPVRGADADRDGERLVRADLPANERLGARPTAGTGRPATATVRTAPGRRYETGLDEVPAVRTGIRLNGPWCAVLLVAGVAGALALTGALGWQPGVGMTVALVAVGVGVALLAGRAGAFEAGVLPGTVVIVVGAAVIAADRGALGGVVAGLGTFGRVWQVIGLLAPAAAATWVCALATLVLRRAGLLRRF